MLTLPQIRVRANCTQDKCTNQIMQTYNPQDINRLIYGLRMKNCSLLYSSKWQMQDSER